MLSLILADDEQLDLDYMLRAVDYEALGLRVIATCRTGSELLQKIEECNPDILITDIVMPGISGIEVAARLKESGSSTKIVFVSGHQNFNYAQNALESGVRGYIVKPVLPEKLEKTLSALVEECINENKLKYEQELFSTQLNENMPLLRELLARQLVSGVLPPDTLEERLRFYNIPLTSENLQAILLLPDRDPSAEITSEYSESLLLLSLKNTAESFFQSRNICFCSILDSGALTLIINLPALASASSAEIKNISYSLATELQSSLLTSSGLAVTVGLGLIVNGYENIHSSLVQARHALDMRLFLGKDNVISLDDISDSKAFIQSALEQFKLLIREAVNLGDCTRIDHLFDDICTDIANAHSLERVKLFAAELLSVCVSDQIETWGKYSDGARLSAEYSDLLSAHSLPQLLDNLKQITLRIASENHLHMNDRGSQVVAMIDDILKKRYAEDLSVDSISAMIYISPSYTSRIYKKLTGNNIINQLTLIRMQKASEFLKDPQYKISDVANLTGFTNISYFSSVFRKHFGYSPTRYRELYVSSENDN
ncbi:MAG: response regulator [Ruminococcaceae bacterium]|nr:response regulator [Oscillospiraceae bacterium]